MDDESSGSDCQDDDNSYRISSIEVMQNGGEMMD